MTLFILLGNRGPRALLVIFLFYYRKLVFWKTLTGLFTPQDGTIYHIVVVLYSSKEVYRWGLCFVIGELGTSSMTRVVTAVGGESIFSTSQTHQDYGKMEIPSEP